MLQTVTANLAIVLLLACPYLCMGEAVGACLELCQADACCCPQDGGTSDHQTPSSPDGNDPDCLCRGAVVDSVRSTELHDSAPPTINWPIGDVRLTTINVSSATIPFESPHHFPPFSTGRDVCALTCALLF